MKCGRGVAAGLLVVVSFSASSALGQLLPCGPSVVDYAGHVPQDFRIPDVAPGTLMDISIWGADGGDVIVGPSLTCIGQGGEGAGAWGRYTIGNGPNQLKPGGTLRFIIGEHPAGIVSIGNSAEGITGGGGGSGVFYFPPLSTECVVLAVAGGGGGGTAWSGWEGLPLVSSVICVKDIDGLPGNTATSGRDGSPAGGDSANCRGGTNGQGGAGYQYIIDTSPTTYGHVSGGGGGLYGNATRSDTLGGRAAFSGGLPVGGAGGVDPGYNGHGGWGCGGGGAGQNSGYSGAGGGGGYSGGGGSYLSGAGGGGGSYLNTSYVVGGDISIGSSGRHGRANVEIYAIVPNDGPDGAVPLYDGLPVASPPLCGATAEPFQFCSTQVFGADVWYSYTNTSACRRTVTVGFSAGSAAIYAYNAGTPFDPNSCRVRDTGGVLVDTLDPAQTILLRVAGIQTPSFSIVATSAYAPGQADCDSDGIPDACDVSDDCPPPNDNRANAIPITDSVVPYDMNFSTVDGSSPCDNVVYGDIWYTFTAQDDGQFGIVDQSEPLQGDRVITFYDGVGGQVLYCTGDYNTRPIGSDQWTSAFLPVKAGQTILIRIANSAVASGPFATGSFWVVFADSVPNDRCADAIVLTSTPGEAATHYFDTRIAEDSGDVPGNCAAFDRLDVWFKYTTMNSGSVSFEALSQTGYHAIELFEACGGAAIDCANEQFGVASITRQAAAGTTFLIRIAGYTYSGSGYGTVQVIEWSDYDQDGLADVIDPDDDNDLVPDEEDSEPFNRYACRDLDRDGCDDCASGVENSADDGVDTDGDGICDHGDLDDDGDSVIDILDADPLNAFICGDSDNDGCDDCAITGGPPNPANDGADFDMDGLCDGGDLDADNDGVSDLDEILIFQSNPFDPYSCGDRDGDGCDDCSSTGGPPAPATDGADYDGDGLCDSGDPDTDNDGLPNFLEGPANDEQDFGTDPYNGDSDGDGLLDGTEVGSAMGTGCTSPTNPDSDGDTLSDGDEVVGGTNPCNADTDGDGVPDNIDPTPTVPGVPASYLESEARTLANDTLPQLDLSLFSGPNTNANRGRRSSLTSRAADAANAIAAGNYALALEELRSLLSKIDGQAPDWLADTPERAALAAQVSALISLLE